nr:MAG TPA: hypothetical protein [Caudoviricetes sp.]
MLILPSRRLFSGSASTMVGNSEHSRCATIFPGPCETRRPWARTHLAAQES